MPDINAKTLSSWNMVRELLQSSPMPHTVPIYPLLAALALAHAARSQLSAPPRATTALIRGVCLAAENKTRLPGCVITIEVENKQEGSRVPRSLLSPPPVTTDDDGRFEIRVLARKGCQVRLRIEHPERCTQTGTRGFLRPTENYSVRASLRRGYTKTGIIRTKDGQPLQTPLVFDPQPKLRLPWPTTPGPVSPSAPPSAAIPAPPPGREFKVGETSRITASSNRAGEFRIGSRIAPGIYRIQVRKRGFYPVDGRELIVDGSGQLHSVRAAELPNLRGTVVDGAGQPVSGVKLKVKNNRYGPAIGCETGADGRFVIYRSGPCQDVVPIEIRTESPCVPRSATNRYPWGTADIRIQVRRLPQVELRVLAADTGKPVERFAVRMDPLNVRSAASLTRLRHQGRHPNGTVLVHDVLLGAMRLWVVPEDQALLPISTTIRGEFGMKPITIRTPRLTPKQVTLTDQAGAPIAGMLVQVIRPGNRRLSTEVLIDHRAPRLRARSGNFGDRFDTLVSEARTDAVGQCVVYGTEGKNALILVLSRGAIVRRKMPVQFGKKRLSQRIVLRSR